MVSSSLMLVPAVATPAAANPDGITVTLNVSFEGHLTEACQDTGMDFGWALGSDMDYYDGYGGDPAYPNPPPWWMSSTTMELMLSTRQQVITSIPKHSH